jgi:hypothetical protein
VRDLSAINKRYKDVSIILEEIGAKYEPIMLNLEQGDEANLSF